MKPAETIFTTQTGTGTPVVALHGSVSSGNQWTGLGEYVRNGYRVVAPDLPGYGRSQSIMLPGSMDAMADALAPILYRQDQPVHLVGHSFGGAVATRLAQQFPDHVRSLTVIEPTVFNYVFNDPSDEVIDLEAIFDVVHRMESAIDAGDDASAMGIFVDFWNGQGAWSRTSPRLAEKLAPFARQTIRDFVTIASDGNTWSDLSRVKCPVHILSGSVSPREIRQVTHRFAAEFPQAKHTVVEGAGHMLPLTDPHIVDVEIRKFLVQCDREWQIMATNDRKAA